MPSQRKRRLQLQSSPQSQSEAEAPPTSTPQTPPLSVIVIVELLGTPLALLTLAALASPISQATLSPVFGAIPSAINHQEAVILTPILAFLLRHFFKDTPYGLVAKLTAVWAFWIPVIQVYLFRWSGFLGPKAGPGVIGFLSCHTLIIPSVYAAAEALEVLQLQERFGTWYGVFGPAAIGVYHLVTVERWFQAYLPALTLEFSIFAPVAIQLILAALFAALSSSKLLLLALPALLHTMYLNPHFDSPTTTDLLNSTLSTHNWALLDRQWSNTGYISVLENPEQQYRVLRCDHSLLGGEWLLTDERRKEGWSVNEPIYPAFEMLEAIRMIEQDPAIPDTEAQALVIGLGIGTAPKALLAHGINTTIIEVDPIIHSYAMKYFDLPSNHTAIITDAVHYISELAAAASSSPPNDHIFTQYDYIIHDVFTGGAEPLFLFTDQFIQNLRSLLTTRGTLAIIYAGDVTLPLTKRVLNTIDKNFDGQCRIYRDTAPSPDPSGADGENGNFANMLIFCRNAPGPITFRQPVETDFLGSKSRENYLLPDPGLEMQFPLSGSANRSLALQDQILKADDEAAWSSQIAQSAIRHWHIMRTVVPDVVWELW